jgi:hypothetical protein
MPALAEAELGEDFLAGLDPVPDVAPGAKSYTELVAGSDTATADCRAVHAAREALIEGEEVSRRVEREI